jgi:hypothetical protein
MATSEKAEEANCFGTTELENVGGNTPRRRTEDGISQQANL